MVDVPWPQGAPEPVLRVGVAGHRDLGNFDVARLRAQVHKVLAQVQEEARRACPPTEPSRAAPVRLVLVSSLAEGSDLLVAEEAHALGYELQVILPFTKEDMRTELERHRANPTTSAADLASFDALLAGRKPVVELAAPWPAQPASGTHSPYAAAARLMLSHSDLLLAIWDPAHDAKPAGTAEVAERAIRAGMPVLRITPLSGQEPELCREGWEGMRCEPWRAAGEAAVARLLAPLADSPGDPPPSEEGHGVPSLREKRRAYAAYLEERRLEDRPRLARWLARRIQGAWRLVLRLGGPLPAPPTGDQVLSDPELRRADELASYYQALYRGSFVLLYALGMGAVAFALLGYWLHGLCCPPPALRHSAELVGALEIWTLVAIAVLYQEARRRSWYEKGREYRVLAELLRQQAAVGVLGLTAPVPRPRARAGWRADVGTSWMGTHARALAAARGLPHLCVKEGAFQTLCKDLRARWLSAQIAYHARLGTTFRRVAGRLENLTHLLFLLAIVACLLHLAVHGLSLWAAWFPAVAAAVHGILGYADFERHAERSHDIVAELSLLQTEWDDLGEGASWHATSRIAEDAAGVMLAEMDDWQRIMSHRDLRLP